MGEPGLRGSRVLELATGVAAAFAGKLLATYGATVVKVESPDGDPARRADLSGEGEPHPEASPLYLHLNTGKRSLTLALESEEGRRALRELVAAADVLLEDLGPQALASLGLSWEALHVRHSHLVMVSLSPFGSSGPYTDYKATSLVSFAMGGQMSLTGEPEGPPMSIYGCQPEYQTGLHGFAATLLCLLDVLRGNAGQRVEIATMEVEAAALEFAGPVAWIHGLTTPRFGSMVGPTWGIFPAREGYVGIFGLHNNFPAIAEAIGRPELAADGRFATIGELLDHADELEAHMRAWCIDQTPESAYRRGGETGAPIAPVLAVPELLKWPGLLQKRFWRSVDHPVAGRAAYPGPAITLGEGHAAVRPAPLLGEHTEEVLRDWVASSHAPAHLREAPTHQRRGPLEGIRILDLTRMWSGPYASMLLGDMGAEVIKVEGPEVIDLTRVVGAHTDDEKARLYTPYFNQYNRNKLGIAVDIKHPRGRHLILRLAERCDVVLENFRGGVLERLGLDYQAFKTVKPDIVFCSMPAFASSGPEREHAAYGPVVEAMSGLQSLGGREGDPPLLSGISYGDPVAGTLAAGAVLLGLIHRQRTGHGQRMEVSQRDNLLDLIGEVFVAYSLAGKLPPRLGNRHPRWAPQGCYPCRPLGEQEAPRVIRTGETVTDRWLALSVTNDEEWRALCGVLGRVDLAEDARFADEAGRRRHHDELDAVIATWTRERDPREAAQLLQTAGVPAGPVLGPVDLAADPHLWSRGFFEEVEHSQAGRHLLAGPVWRLSETPMQLRSSGPAFGEHNEDVLRRILGLDDAGIAALRTEGIIADQPGRPAGAVPPGSGVSSASPP